MSELRTIIHRDLEWDAGHRVFNHESKCNHLHGHRYKARIFVTAAKLDDLDRVIDFGVVKGLLLPWINKNWDHATILNSEDPLVPLLQGAGQNINIIEGENPTAEVMARVLFQYAEMLLPETIDVVGVRLWETPNCAAYYGEAPCPG